MTDSSYTNSSYTKTRLIWDKKRELVWKVFAPHLQKKFQLSGHILDLGCGYGSFINHISATYKACIDINHEMKSYIDQSADFFSGDTSSLRTLFQKEKFDTVFSSNLLEHLSRSELQQLFLDIKDILKPGGSFIVFMPNYRKAYAEYFDDYTHLTPLSDRSLGDWLSALGFSIEFSHPGYMPFSVKDSKVPISEFLIRLWLANPWKIGGKQMLIQAKKPLS